MAMTTVHIAAPHHPLAALTGWLRKHFHPRLPAVTAFVTGLDVEALRLALPLDHPDRHALENPAMEDAFAHLAADHPAQVAVASMRDVDREELLLAVVDDWFRHAHPAPEHRWPAAVRAEHDLLLDSVHDCFRPAGGAA